MFLHKYYVAIFLCFYIVQKIQGLRYQNCECGITNKSGNRIIGGWSASPHEYPWLVPIFQKNKLYCGGAIINSLYILTAGHCIRWANINDITIEVGVHNRKYRNKNNIYKAQEFILHPHFYSHSLYDENDIALIKVNKPMSFTEVIKPICLPDPQESVDNEFAIVAGWGKTEMEKPLNTVLQETIVKILSNEDCMKTDMKSIVNPTVMCAFMNKADSCQGDSGGPLVREVEPGKMEQIGIVSWGIGCASNTPGIYTRVAKYLDWIYMNTYDGAFCKNTK